MVDDAPSIDPPALLVWSLASFHTALLVSVLVAGLHLAGAAGDVLSSAGTWLGVAIYGYLWAVTWWTNGRWLGALPPLTATTNVQSVVTGALQWGAVAGLLFFAGLLIPAVVFLAAGAGLEAIPFVLLVAGIGGVLSIAVGAVIGAAFAVIDLLLVRAANRWLPTGNRTTATSGP